jgi:preprotein translocase subunit YajC
MHTAMVLAQNETPGDNGDGAGNGEASPLGGLGMFLPFVLILVVMWFVMMRPQQKQEKRRREMLAQMKKNDRVVTLGGIHGIVYSVDEAEVVLKVDERNDVRLRMAKNAIARVLTEDEAAAAGEKL